MDEIIFAFTTKPFQTLALFGLYFMVAIWFPIYAMRSHGKPNKNSPVHKWGEKIHFFEKIYIPVHNGIEYDISKDEIIHQPFSNEVKTQYYLFYSTTDYVFRHHKTDEVYVMRKIVNKMNGDTLTKAYLEFYHPASDVYHLENSMKAIDNTDTGKNWLLSIEALTTDKDKI